MDSLSIVMVEDNLADVELTKMAFMSGEIQADIKIINDGEQAMNFLLADDLDKPHAIMLDLNLPKVSGFEILEAIKTNEERKGICVIIISSTQSESEINKVKELGADLFITKPEGVDGFVSMVKEVTEFVQKRHSDIESTKMPWE